MDVTQRERPLRAFAKPSGDELSKISQGELVQFVAASVGRVSNLYPHWLLLHVETPLGIPSSRLMVLWLLHSWNEISMGEISRAIDLTPRGVTRIVDGLEEEGLARRAPHKTDKRIKVVRLTNKGHRFVENTFPVARAEFKQLFSVLEKGECLEFIRLLEKVTDEMKNQIDAE